MKNSTGLWCEVGVLSFSNSEMSLEENMIAFRFGFEFKIPTAHDILKVHSLLYTLPVTIEKSKDVFF